jgi:hypothetical protein
MRPHAGREVPGRKEENRWVLRSNIPEEVSLATYVTELLGRSKPCVDKIKALANKRIVVIAGAIHADSDMDYNQEVFLSGEQVDLIRAQKRGGTRWSAPSPNLYGSED